MLRTIFVMLALTWPAMAQNMMSPVGRWRTVDDKTGQDSGIVRLFESNGALYGTIEKIFDPVKAAYTCIKCEDDRKNKPLIGLDFMRGLKRDGEVWDNGTILDPNTGSIYRSSARVTEGGKKLVVRGYLGISLLGRSQTWVREP